MSDRPLTDIRSNVEEIAAMNAAIGDALPIAGQLRSIVHSAEEMHEPGAMTDISRGRLSENIARAMLSYLHLALLYIPVDDENARDLRSRIDGLLWVVGSDKE